MNNIILLGAGGHCNSIIDSLISQNIYNPIGILDNSKHIGYKVGDIKVIGTDMDLKYYRSKGIVYAFICVGSIGNVSVRKKIYKKLKDFDYKLANIIDPSSIVSNNIELGNGNFIAKGTIVNTNTKIGNNTIINTGSIVEHECIIGDFSHIAPGATLCGNVNIGENSHIGANSTVIQGIRVGCNTIVGAGSVVVRDIGSNCKAYGNPCKEVRNV